MGSPRKRVSNPADDLVVGDEQPDSKRTKTSKAERLATTNSSPSIPWKVDVNGDRYWEISKMRRVTVSSFRGKTILSIREYYEKDGQTLPGKKGISLPIDQFAILVAELPNIEIALKEHGESVPRPAYQDSDLPVNKPKAKDSDGLSTPKKNIEATSEEDENEA